MLDEVIEYGPIVLRFDKKIVPQKVGQLVPFYRYCIHAGSQQVGHISLKDGNTEHILKYAGHIGYGVHEKFRGNRYSYFACMALKKQAFDMYGELILTAEDDNKASIRVIELLGAEYLETLAVPKTDPAYKSGGRLRRRYKWSV
ncbi:GNAT family N-acetyltransferase [Vreelandella sp. EE27]